MSIRLFVGNLPYNATEADLREHFRPCGPLTYVYLPTDRETGKPRGFAFVELADRAQAEEAIRRFNNQPFMGRAIAVSEARAKEDRPASTQFTPRPVASVPPPAGERNFGPDDAPRRARKPARGGAKTQRAPKGPMRELTRGRVLFGDDDDDGYLDESDDENFASRERAEDETISEES
jgi:RNA recognition motif-containing protein